MLNSFLTIIATFCLAAVSMFSREAQGMNVGQVLTFAQFNYTMAAEGQHTLAIVNEPAKYKTLMRIFTSNDDGSVGYILDADTPETIKPQNMTVERRMMNVRLFDARKLAVDPNALVSNKDADQPWKEAHAFWKIDSDAHNRLIKSQAQAGCRVMVQGLESRRLSDGSYAVGHFIITLVGQMDGEKRGRLDYTTREGASTVARVFSDVLYTNYAIQKLDPK